MDERRLTASKILVVDDLQPNIDLLRAILRRGGFLHVAATTDSTAALELFASEAPDLVILDLHMPGLNGLEVLEMIGRSTVPGEYLPVLVVTADATIETRELALEIGAHDFLSKPLNHTEVLLRARNLLLARKLWLENADILASTLNGLVQILVQAIESSHPGARGRAARIRELVRQVGKRLEVRDAWQLDLAAILGQLGLLTLPPSLVDAALEGRYLDPDEARAVVHHSRAGADLIRKIPRLNKVADIVALQHARLVDFPTDEDPDDLKVKAAILKAATDCEQLVAAGMTLDSAILRMRERRGWYSAQVLDALAGVDEAAA